MPRRRSTSGTWVRWCLVVFAIASALFVCGPAISWKFKKTLRSRYFCRPCNCDSICPPLSLFKISPDCVKDDPVLNKEMEMQFTELLSDEMKLQETVAEEYLQHMNITIGEARRLGSHYQREAEKCNAATDICEQARERDKALLSKERKLTSKWEH